MVKALALLLAAQLSYPPQDLSSFAKQADVLPPLQVQRKAVVTGTDGTVTASWDVAWPTPPTVVFAQANMLNNPYICQVAGWTVSSFTVKCWQVVPNTLPGTLTSVPNYVISPFTNAAAGVPVSVIGRQ